MNSLIAKFFAFVAEQKGAETVEYAVIAGLLIIIGTTMYGAGGTVSTAISSLGTKITSAI